MRQKKKARAAPREKRPGEFGVYAGHISALQKGRLRAMPPGLGPEIHLLRALVDDALRRMEASRDEAQRRIHFEAAMTALQRLLTAVRTQHALLGAAEKEPDLLDETITWVQADLGLEA